MYKTIRHGENSLQYKILPQNDDFRIEGKLSTAESSCSSSSRKSMRPKRRSFFAYLGLIFVCTVIVGAVLIPFLVSAECLPNPTEWFLKTKAALTHSSADKQQPHANETVTGVVAAAQRQIQYGNGINVGKTVKIISKDGVEKIVLKVNKTATTTTDKNQENVNETVEPSQAGGKILSILNKTFDPETKTLTDTKVEDTKTLVTNEVKEIRFPQQDGNVIPTTISVTTLKAQSPDASDSIQQQQQQQQKVLLQRPIITTTSAYSQPQAAIVVNSPHAPSSASSQAAAATLNSSAPAVPTIMTRIIQVPLLKATAKKPIIPPVLVRTNSQLPDDALSAGGVAKSSSPVDDDINAVPTIIKHTQNSDWIKTHWPYIDPSTYFQWPGYKDEDSVLFPALLGFALIGVILIITVCLVARNKRTIVSSVRRRNRNDIEETGAEDNTTLLTSTNLSDED